MRNKYEMLSFEKKLCRKAMKRTLALPRLCHCVRCGRPSGTSKSLSAPPRVDLFPCGSRSMVVWTNRVPCCGFILSPRSALVVGPRIRITAHVDKTRCPYRLARKNKWSQQLWEYEYPVWFCK
jgi:hypothetical protein